MRSSAGWHDCCLIVFVRDRQRPEPGKPLQIMDEIVKEFLIESYENLDHLDNALVELEKNPRHKESLDHIFRTVHSIKGTCGFIGYVKLQRIAHAGENLLSLLREGVLTMDAEITSALLALMDVIRGILASIEQTESEGESEHPELIATLERLCGAALKEPAEACTDEATPQPVAVAVEMPAIEAVAETPVAPAPVAAAPKPQESAPAEVPVFAVAKKANPENRAHSVSESNIRVDIALIDRLMNLVGELVLARNQIIQDAAASENAATSMSSQRLNHITTELQESVMKTRMQPIGNVWAKLPRVVRDVSSEMGKKVRFEMEGNETELDRTIIEAIKDPLTHIVRNSIDHGIERPEQRILAGKPEEGILRMRAFHEGGQVNIEITDDGAGINLNRVRQKAMDRNLLSAEQNARLTDREAVNLIFLPALSTAEKITSVSGRGVGMDVVKTNIEKIGGSVDLHTELGKGTTLRIKIPLTLAIIPALIITSAGDRYAIPQVSLVELVRLEGEEAKKSIERIFQVPVYRLRGKLLPLVFLNSELDDDGCAISARSQGDNAMDRSSVTNIVVLQAGDHQFGLVVDQINDTQEIVVKPLGRHLKGIRIFAGATIMGDGRVALILDVLGLAQAAHLATQATDKLRAEQERDEEPEVVGGERQTLLIVETGYNERLAVPLNLVGRLEQFQQSQVETAGPMEVVQYRNAIMPLIRICHAIGCSEPDTERERLHVVVYTSHGRSVGLVVGSIADIVQDVVKMETSQRRHGILGTAVIQGRVIEIVDVPAIVSSAIPDMAEMAM
jgi:two-component system, chemotaxis family, sensor kinase CheA